MDSSCRTADLTATLSLPGRTHVLSAFITIALQATPMLLWYHFPSLRWGTSHFPAGLWSLKL